MKSDRPNKERAVEIEKTSSDPLRIAVRGEVDADNCQDARHAIMGHTGSESTPVLDISELTFLDSSGISALLQIKSDLEAGGGSLTLENPTESVHRVLQITGLLELFGLSAANT